jgi:hypothetical protein
MSRTAARFTQADIVRSVRAAMQAGAGAVELRPDGTIRISLTAEPNQVDKVRSPVETGDEVVL